MHKKLLMGSGLAALLSAAAMAPAAIASEPDGCAAHSTAPGGTSSCTWTADAPGAFAGVAASWSVVEVTFLTSKSGSQEVDVPVTSPTTGTPVIASAPGTLLKGHTYRLTVTNGAGVMGNASGGAGPA